MTRKFQSCAFVLIVLPLILAAGCKPYIEKLDEENKRKQMTAEVNANVRKHLSNAQAFAKSENYRLASQEYRTVIEKYPQFGEIAEVYYSLSQMQFAMDDRQGQIKSLEEVVQRAPDHENALYDLAEAYEFTGDLKKAEEYALRAINVNPDDTRYTSLLEKIRNKRQGL
jgi:tetratricopeptide (TPR) repeat protein